jgi:glycerol uptake facilitator-like aquaporin
MNVSNRYKDTAIAGFVIGLTLMAIVSAGSLFNPAVAIASIVCNVIKDGGAFGGMSSVIVYIAGPLLGGFAASYMFDYFRAEPVHNNR